MRNSFSAAREKLRSDDDRREHLQRVELHGPILVGDRDKRTLIDTRTIINLPNLDRCARFDPHGDARQVFIFDTTLRDGEQAPGCSMTISEKVRMAGKLAELGVDIMEAGFPIASTGDFEAVQAVEPRRCP